jgi:hypothetical protein
MKIRIPTLVEIVANDPWAPGTTQKWAPRMARKIRDHRRHDIQSAYDAMIASLGAELNRKRESEIRRAVERVYNDQLTGESGSNTTGNNWRESDVAETVATVDHEGAINLASYANSAKNRIGDFATYEVLERLFYTDALLCVGESFSRAEIRPLKSLRSLDLSRFEFIVPTQATKRVGKNQDGADSVRCLDTIGERRFLVIEFDFDPEKPIWADPVNHWHGKGWTTKDASARLVHHLYERFKREPAMIVDSGNKSIHAWYWFRDEPENVAREFMAAAASLGADPALFVRCQWCRFPGGPSAGLKMVGFYRFESGPIVWPINC